MRIELLSPHIRLILNKAGWNPGRRAADLVSRWKHEFFDKEEFVLFPSAEECLLELGGLHFEQRGAGENVALGDFFFDPTVAVGESDRFADFEKIIGTRLCPIGEAENGYSYLAIAEDGLMLSLMDDG
jgi:hypothetical protein